MYLGHFETLYMFTACYAVTLSYSVYNDAAKKDPVIWLTKFESTGDSGLMIGIIGI